MKLEKNSSMACVLKKISTPCSGRRATSTPSPFLWSSLARCAVKRRACLLSTQRALCSFPWQKTRVSQAPSRWECKWMAVPWGEPWGACSVLQEAAPKFLLFTLTQNPGSASFLLWFFWAPPSPLCFSPALGKGKGITRGSWLLLAPRAVVWVTRHLCWVLFGLWLGQDSVLHRTPGGEGIIGSSHWGRGSEPQPVFKSNGRVVFPTYSTKYRFFWTGLKTECELGDITSCVYFDIGSCSDVP